jgi:predicted MFS family arabinose efflux permease
LDYTVRRRLRGFVVTADADNALWRANVGDKVRPVEWPDPKRLLRPMNGASRTDCSVNSFFPLGERVSTLGSNSKETVSFAAPFRHAAFAVIWTATLVSNVGGWMYSAASGWLMTGLNPDPLIVALVQAASSLPICLFAIPAGALADIFDKRKYLLVVESLYTVLAVAYAILVGLNLATPINLLVFTFVLGAAGALTSPAWQAVVPQLVSKRDLSAAIAANSVGVNISRALGPAIGGAIISPFGIVAPFWLNAISNLGIVGALLWWRERRGPRTLLPAERFGQVVLTGFRYVRHNFALRCTLMRAIGFFLFASAYWALLPLVAREQIAGGPSLYGVLLGAIGVGAVGGAFFLGWLKLTLGPNHLMAIGALGQALAMVLYGLAREPLTALAAGIIAGASWIAALATLSVSAQVALPDWVRGRGLALYTTVFFGCLTLGSVAWGEIAVWVGLPIVHFLAAAGAIVAIPLTWRWKLQTELGVDLSPSMHWPAPIMTQSIAKDRGPVLVTVEYHIDPENRPAFLRAMAKLEHVRRRDGAYAWGIFEDTSQAGRMVETFLVESWIEHLRQHERVTKADRIVQDAVARFNLEGEPKVTHFVAAEP